jgi:hypothetical protein
MEGERKVGEGSPDAYAPSRTIHIVLTPRHRMDSMDTRTFIFHIPETTPGGGQCKQRY